MNCKKLYKFCIIVQEVLNQQSISIALYYKQVQL